MCHVFLIVTLILLKNSNSRLENVRYKHSLLKKTHQSGMRTFQLFSGSKNKIISGKIILISTQI